MSRPVTPSINDGGDAPPRLRLDLNFFMLETLPEGIGPRGTLDEKLAAVAAAGYAGVQGGDPARCAAHGLVTTASGGVRRPEEVEPLAARDQAAGHEATTLHVGSGMEADAGIDALIAEVVDVSARLGYPLFVETHRATATQDIWRTVELVRRNPGVRFNGDFSHWYTGLEMVYGDFAAKLEFLAPVLERVRFFHGRIGDPGSIQVAVDPTNPGPFVGHFREIWTRAMAGFLRTAQPGDILPFAPELLPPGIFYARCFRDPTGAWVEESDRWEQGLILARLAQECFAEAQRRVADTPRDSA